MSHSIDDEVCCLQIYGVKGIPFIEISFLGCKVARFNITVDEEQNGGVPPNLCNC